MDKIFKKVKKTDRFMTAVFYGIAIFFFVLLAAFVGYVVVQGFAGFEPAFLSFSDAGIGNQLFNTVYLVFLSLLVCVPLGIAAGIYMAEYAKDNRATRFLRVCIETLSSLPSIVVGLFGYLVLIVMTGSHWNLMAGAIAVSILNLPLLATVTEDAFRSLPTHYKEGSLSLGATHWQTIVHVLLPSCLPRIFTGVIMAAGRGFGEAAALLYTAGMSTNINWGNWDLTSPGCPLNPFRPGETLALQIWASRTEAIAPNATQIANFCSAILLILVFVFSISARILSRSIDRKMTSQDK